MSRLPYHGNSDLFEEINELVNDPKKARLLDGLKRASRNDFEMSNMLASLRRWLKRPQADKEAKLIFSAAFDISLRNTPTEQLNPETIAVPNFKGDMELAGVFSVIFNPSLYELGTNKSFLHDSLPPTLPGRHQIITVLNRLGDGIGGHWGCMNVMRTSLEFYQGPKYWEEVLSYNVYMMKGLSKIPDEFFEEFGKLKGKEDQALNRMLFNANLQP